MGFNPLADQRGKIGGIFGAQSFDLFEEKWQVGGGAGNGGHGFFDVVGHDGFAVLIYSVGLGGFDDCFRQGVEPGEEIGDGVFAHT